MNKASNEVDSYIAAMPKEVRSVLIRLRGVIKKAAPKAWERISYGMPFYEYGGSGYKGRLIYFATFKKHISVFIAPGVAGQSLGELEKYRASKSSFHFPLYKPLPFALIGRTVRQLVKKLDTNAKSK